MLSRNYTWLLLLGFGLLSTSRADGSAALSPETSTTSAASKVGNEVAVDAVDLLFLFDHVFMKSSTAISADYLKRIADPKSPFHPTYVAYEQRKISRRELTERLPHVAMIGDSLSKNAYVSSIPSTFWRVRTERRRDWFLDTNSSPASVDSVFERLERLTPLVATEQSGVGAIVDRGDARESFARRLIRTRNFSGQVDQVLKARRYPDLIMLWIGHNNLDWAAETPVKEREHPEKRFEEWAKKFEQNYRRQLRRLMARAEKEDHKVAIVVFGLVNFEAFFKARAETEALRENNRKLYPYLEIDYRHFLSMRPAYRGGMIRLALMMNKELYAMVTDLNRQCPPNVQLRYSDALANVDIGRAELIHAMDAWHPSVKGHSLLAKAAFSALPPSLEFLGIEQKTNASSVSKLGQQSASR
jgi:lysophospholipase L1-like esterase